MCLHPDLYRAWCTVPVYVQAGLCVRARVFVPKRVVVPVVSSVLAHVTVERRTVCGPLCMFLDGWLCIAVP